MNTSQEFLKCRLNHFSLSYATENYMICTVAPNFMKLLDNICRVFQGYLFIFTKKI